MTNIEPGNTFEIIKMKVMLIFKLKLMFKVCILNMLKLMCFLQKKMLKNCCLAVACPARDKCRWCKGDTTHHNYILKLHRLRLSMQPNIQRGRRGGETCPKKMTLPPTDRNRFSYYFSIHPIIWLKVGIYVEKKRHLT